MPKQPRTPEPPVMPQARSETWLDAFAARCLHAGYPCVDDEGEGAEKPRAPEEDPPITPRHHQDVVLPESEEGS